MAQISPNFLKNNFMEIQLVKIYHKSKSQKKSNKKNCISDNVISLNFFNTNN